jgi:hypothetical protein
MIELPRDAKGREIPLDVDALYDKNGNRVEVFRWNYVRGRDNNWTFNRLLEFVTVPLHPQDYFLTPPDSWEKLEEDLDRCIKADSLCAYSPSEECSTCVLPRDSQCHCDSLALEAIKERIHELRGEGE